MLNTEYLSRINAPQIVYNIIHLSSSVLYLIFPLSAIYILIKGSKSSKFFLFWFLIFIAPFLPFNTPLLYKGNPLASWHLYGAAVGLSILVGIFTYRFYELLKRFVRKSIAKFIVVFLVSIFIVANIFAINLIEKYKFRNTGDEAMIKFLKNTHTTFPKGSKLYFVNDTLPFRSPVLQMVISLYYQDGPLVPHAINTGSDNYTIYYSSYYEIYEISKNDISSIVVDNDTYIFDYNQGAPIEIGGQLHG